VNKMQLLDERKQKKLLEEKARVESELLELKKVQDANEKEKQDKKDRRTQLESKWKIECGLFYVDKPLGLRLWKFTRDYLGDPSKYEQIAKAYNVYDFLEEMNQKYPAKKGPRFTEDNEQIV